MSQFSVTIYPIEVHPHDNADRLEVGSIPGQGYQFVVGKGQFQNGDLFAYIPEQAVVPEALLVEMDLSGRLDGPDRNRVRAQRLRGVMSQGLAYRPKEWPEHWVEGLDVAAELGITKYEQPIPAQLRGKVKPAPRWRPSAPGTSIWQGYTDIDHLRKFQTVMEPGEVVVLTEKLHGTCLNVLYQRGLDGSDEVFVSSLGVARSGLILEEEEKNVYWRVVRDYDLPAKMAAIATELGVDQLMLFGEIIGVQDMKYGLKNGDLAFYAFDIKIPGPDANERKLRLLPPPHPALEETNDMEAAA